MVRPRCAISRLYSLCGVPETGLDGYYRGLFRCDYVAGAVGTDALLTAHTPARRSTTEPVHALVFANNLCVSNRYGGRRALLCGVLRSGRCFDSYVFIVCTALGRRVKPCLGKSWPSARLRAARLTANASFGFEPPVAEVDALSRRLSGADLVQLRLQSRVLPAAAVTEAVEERIQEFVARTTREPSRKEKRDLKDEVISQLMPRTLLKSDRIRGFYVRDAKILALTVASATTCELFIEALRDALETLQVNTARVQTPRAHAHESGV